MQINFANTPLKKALDDLGTMANANIYVPWKVVNDEGASESTPINVKVRDVPLRRALSLVLADATGGDSRLSYEVEDGVIEIVSRDVSAWRAGTRAFESTRFPFTIRPDSWKTFALPGGFSYSDSGLILAEPTEVMKHRGNVGETLELEVTGSTEGMIWGSGVYTDDSPLETAAVHAGLLKPGERGTLRVTILPGQSSHEGSLRNGVRSDRFGVFDGSYRMECIQ